MSAGVPDFPSLPLDRRAPAALVKLRADAARHAAARPRSFTAAEALAALELEAGIVLAVAGFMREDGAISDEHMARLALAQERISTIAREATRIARRLEETTE